MAISEWGFNLEGAGEYWAWDGALDEHGQGLNPFVIYPERAGDVSPVGRYALIDYRNVEVGNVPRGVVFRGTLEECKAAADRLHAERPWPTSDTLSNCVR